jgi:phosphate transport system substrate-binding protein
LKNRIVTAMISTIAAGALLAGCASNEQPAQTNKVGGNDNPTATLSGTIAGAGASSQNAAQEAWRAGIQADNADFTVNYDPVGSGSGREAFTNGSALFAGTDKAFKTDAAAGPFGSCAVDSALIELPVYISPIAVAFNLDGIDSLNLDADTIAGIFAGKITKWNDLAIADQNSGVTLPDSDITPVHRGDKSGTTENFTDYLAKAAPSVWTYEVEETWPADLAGEAAEKTSGVASTITSTAGAVGYLDASQAKGMGTVALKVGDKYVPYSPEAAAKAVAASSLDTEGRAANDIVVKLDRTLTDDSVYPMVLVSYLAACQQYAKADDAKLVQGYLEYVISADGQAAAAKQAGSAPITGTDLESKVKDAVASIK